jgi:hypothetical protein
MLRQIPQPLHAGGLEADVGVEAAGDGAVDDGLLLLLQQLDSFLFVPKGPALMKTCVFLNGLYRTQKIPSQLMAYIHSHPDN